MLYLDINLKVTTSCISITTNVFQTRFGRFYRQLYINLLRSASKIEKLNKKLAEGKNHSQ